MRWHVCLSLPTRRVSSMRSQIQPPQMLLYSNIHRKHHCIMNVFRSRIHLHHQICSASRTHFHPTHIRPDFQRCQRRRFRNVALSTSSPPQHGRCSANVRVVYAQHSMASQHQGLVRLGHQDVGDAGVGILEPEVGTWEGEDADTKVWGWMLLCIVPRYQ
jgi:hypothetical protein